MEEDDSDNEQKKVKVAEELTHVCEIEIPFASKHAAEITKSSLEVDQEINPTKVERTFKLNGSTLIVEIKATESRLLRASVASFFDMAMVSVRFLAEFDNKSSSS